MARESGLLYDDMAHMNINAVFDYVYAWADLHNPDKKKKSKAREATQEDIDRFFG